MLATVTLNPSLDKTLYVEALALDDSNRCARFRYDPGGKGLNVSRVLWELGEPSLVFGFLGGSTGRRVQKYLHDEGLLCDFNWTAGETRENLVICVEGQPAQTKLNLAGPTIRADELARLKRKLAGRAREYDTLVLSGSLPPGLASDVYRQLADDARLRGVRVVIDADGPALREGLLARPAMIKPNLHELQRLMGRPLPTEVAIEAALDELIAGGQVELVVLTRGDGPALAWSPDRRLRCHPPPVKAASSVGAGDSLIAGMLHAQAGGADLAEALAWGVAAGAACASSAGTELAHIADVRALRAAVVVEEAGSRA